MQWLWIMALAFDLGSVKTEPNLERRSELAIENAHAALTSAREAYTSGNLEKTQAGLDEVDESVDLAFDSLVDTGKDPRKSSKFKKAELRTRELLRRLEGLRDLVSFADRFLVERVQAHVSEVHDNLLKGIMSKRKKK